MKIQKNTYQILLLLKRDNEIKMYITRYIYNPFYYSLLIARAKAYQGKGLTNVSLLELRRKMNKLYV